MVEKKEKRENAGKKFGFRVCTWAGIFSGRASRVEFCVRKNETLMGKTFGLSELPHGIPENRDYFSLP